MSVELFVLEGDNNSPHYEVVALEGDFSPSQELNGELYGELAVDTVIIEKTDLHGNVTEYKIGLNPDHELYGFKVPRVKAPKVKAPKMRMRVNTRGISKGFKSVGKAVSSAGKAYVKAHEKILKDVGKGLGKVGSSLTDLMNQDEDSDSEEDPENEQADATDSEDSDTDNSDTDNSDVASEELNGFLSMIGAAAGSVVAPGIGTGIGSSLGSMLEKKQKGKAKPKKQTKKSSRPEQSSNQNYPQQNQNFNPQNNYQGLQQFAPQGQAMPDFRSFGNTAFNKINQYNNQASNQNQAYKRMFEDSFPTLLRQNSDGSLAMSFGQGKNLWELDGELNGFWSFLGIPDKEEIQNHIITAAAAGVAVGYLLNAFINKKKKRKK